MEKPSGQSRRDVLQALASAGAAVTALPAGAQENAARTHAPSGNQGTIAQTLGGYDAGPSQIARKLARNVSATQGAAQGATLFCSGEKTSHELAVFANRHD